MINGKWTKDSWINSCLIAVWAGLTILLGFLTVTKVQAAESDVPEVLRYAQEYTRDSQKQLTLQPEESLSRRLARSELIRRQQRARIESLEKQLQAQVTTGAATGAKDVARLTRELNASGEAVRTLTQKLSQVQQEKSGLLEQISKISTAAQTAGAEEAGRLKSSLVAAGDQVQKLTAQVAALQQEKSALETQQAEGKKALAQAESSLKNSAGEVSRLGTDLAAVRNNVATLEKQKADLEKALQTVNKSPVATVKLETAAQRQAYAAGVMYARDVREARDGNRLLGIEFDATALNAGLTDVLVGKKLRLAPEALATATQELEKVAAESFRTVTARQAELAEKWLSTFRKEKGVARDESGFWYRVTYEGNGEYLKPDDTVDVVVEERLADGKVVSDMDRAGSSLRQKVADFPPVFAAGLVRLKNHGQITLAVPPELAYGDRGYPPDVPPGAMMIYNIRVSDVIPATPVTAAGRQQE